MENILVSWSGGKDSALALQELGNDSQYHIAALLTTVTEGYDRISMHGVRRVLLERQAATLGLPLEIVWIPKNASNEVYEARMGQALEKYKRAGVNSVAFGDIFLEDLRQYRLEKLAQLDLQGLFPLWKRDTRQLAGAFIQAGFKAITTCVDTQTLGEGFVGRRFDAHFLAELPASVDPCGENGEFHSFVYDGPLFKQGIAISLGERILREQRFYYCDLIPAG
jgi:uncharacterized protein (TIGR00290 family)